VPPYMHGAGSERLSVRSTVKGCEVYRLRSVSLEVVEMISF
jgi:hypothetical protein